MKNLIKSLLLVALTVNQLSAQTVVNVTQDFTINSGPNQYSNYTINVSTGVTLTIDMDVILQNTIINGGNIIINSKVTYSSASSLNNTNITVNGTGGIANSGSLVFKNSTINFKNTSTYVVSSSVELNNSKMKFSNNANMVATAGSINLKNGSTLTAGDGTSTSKAFIKLNGATLNEYDNSYVSLANFNNYYFNWSNYNAIANNTSVKTTNNTLNCNVNGKNACSAPLVYGPASLSFAGISNTALLPVKLSSFGVKVVNNAAEIAWTTDAEMNARSFDVERSNDAQTWGTAGSVKATGNSSVVSSYEFRDALKVGGKYYYRLKMIDQDGGYSYSPVRSVNVEGTIEMTIYPNPAAEYVMIRSKNGADDKLNIQLLNQTGQVVKQINGNGNSVLSVNSFNNGNYFVRVINANGSVQSFKLMIKK
jgi:hypothetical protein